MFPVSCYEQDVRHSSRNQPYRGCLRINAQSHACPRCLRARRRSLLRWSAFIVSSKDAGRVARIVGS